MLRIEDETHKFCEYQKTGGSPTMTVATISTFMVVNMSINITLVVLVVLVVEVMVVVVT